MAATGNLNGTAAVVDVDEYLARVSGTATATDGSAQATKETTKATPTPQVRSSGGPATSTRHR
jgi:hypothetical protein